MADQLCRLRRFFITEYIVATFAIRLIIDNTANTTTLKNPVLVNLGACSENVQLFDVKMLLVFLVNISVGSTIISLLKFSNVDRKSRLLFKVSIVTIIFFILLSVYLFSFNATERSFLLLRAPTCFRFIDISYPLEEYFSTLVCPLDFVTFFLSLVYRVTPGAFAFVCIDKDKTKCVVSGCLFSIGMRFHYCLGKTSRSSFAFVEYPTRW